MFEDKCSKHLKGVNCDVKNCVYNDSERYCTACEIAVGPSYACNCGDTCCSTFKEKKD